MGWTALWALVLASASCAPPASSGDCLNNDTPSTGVDGGIQCDLPFDPREPDGSDGRFAIKVVQYIHVNAAGIVETDTIGSAIGYADLSYDPSTGNGVMSLKMCDLIVPKVEIPGQPLPSIFTVRRDTLELVAPAVAAFTLDAERTCATFTTDPAVVLVAARLSDTLLDPLPTDADSQTCPSPEALNCLYDVDLDSKPAATVGAENVPGLEVDELYATLRAWVAFDGLVGRDDLLLGVATFGLDLAVVGCRIEPLGGGEKRSCNATEVDVMTQVTPTFEQTVGMESSFQAVRVSPDIDCPTVNANAHEIFGR
ncbi:MAG: hypothetical protein ABI333_20435 [bacterium]